MKVETYLFLLLAQPFKPNPTPSPQQKNKNKNPYIYICFFQSSFSYLENMEIKAEKCRVVMLVYPLQGHINPMLQLANILYSKGISIIIAYPSDFNPLNPSNHPEFTYLPLKAADVCGLEITNVVDGVGGIIGFTAVLNKIYKEPFEKSVQELMENDNENEGKRGKIRCIIYDVFMYFAQSVADQFKIPGISLRTSCAATILGITATHNPGCNLPVHGKYSSVPY